MSRNRAHPDDLVHDWNQVDAPPKPPRPVMLDDETLRDGLQGPSVTDPPIETKKAILRAMDALGIDTADVGLPGAGPKAVADATALCRQIVEERLSIRPNCAARTMQRDTEPIARIAASVGIPVEACLFIGSSAIRQYAEDWSIDLLLQRTNESITFAVKEGLPVMYVTEDTSRAHPDTLRRLYRTAIDCGARRVCVTDTVGHATPHGAGQVIRFVAGIVDESGAGVGIDWHGHPDPGLGLAHVLAAIAARARRVPRCGARLGEGARKPPPD